MAVDPGAAARLTASRLVRRLLVLLGLGWLMLGGAAAAQAQSCSVVASASRNYTNVRDSGQLAHLRVLASAGTSDVFDQSGMGGADNNPASPAYACASSTLTPSPRSAATPSIPPAPTTVRC